ncbi:MAG: hypothetical protein JOZ40_13635 [Methylobacteriaceae bacterium]|nr:hypothetical protein [Methylobacteriaceae bacterium]
MVPALVPVAGKDLDQRGTFELWHIGLAALARDFRQFGETGDIIVAPE